MTDTATWLTILCPYCHQLALHEGATKGEVVIITKDGVTTAWHIKCKEKAEKQKGGDASE